MTEDEQPPEGCLCSYTSYKSVSDEFWMIVRTWPDANCPVHAAKEEAYA